MKLIAVKLCFHDVDDRKSRSVAHLTDPASDKVQTGLETRINFCFSNNCVQTATAQTSCARHTPATTGHRHTGSHITLDRCRYYRALCYGGNGRLIQLAL